MASLLCIGSFFEVCINELSGSEVVATAVSGLHQRRSAAPHRTSAWLETGLGGLNALALFARELEKNEP